MLKSLGSLVNISRRDVLEMCAKADVNVRAYYDARLAKSEAEHATAIEAYENAGMFKKLFMTRPSLSLHSQPFWDKVARDKLLKEISKIQNAALLAQEVYLSIDDVALLRSWSKDES